MKKPRQIFPMVAAAVLLLMYGLAVTSMKDDSPTFDEQGFLVRGLAYLRGEERGGKRDIRVGHPLGLNALNATFLVNDPTVQLPTDHPSWLETSFHRPAELFLWEIGNDVAHIMFLARMPTIWLGMLLAVVGCRWATELAILWRKHRGPDSRWPYLAGAMALLLLALDPNILAHTRFVTTDLGLAAGAGLAGYTLWRFVRQPGWRAAFLAGAALGLLLNTKFTSLLFLPLFAIVIIAGFVGLRREESIRHRAWFLVMTLSAYPLAALLMLWAGHGFQSAPLQATLPIVGQVDGVTVPLQNYIEQLLDIGNRLGDRTPSFLLGDYSDSGWWYYFPIAFLVKTPLPILVLLVWAIGRVVIIAIRRREWLRVIWFDLIALLVPATGYFAIALTTEINLGYRHLLPVLPFLYVLIASVISEAVTGPDTRSASIKSRVAVGLSAWLVLALLAIYPHFLAFFNLLAGGPDNGWRALVDSNLDWGQDLFRLSEWQAESGIAPIWLSFFGEARPDYYGINYIGLDSFAPRLMNPDARPFYPPDPAPGWYAISATTLQGVHFANHDQFAVFRDRKPQEKIGYSLFIFEQPLRGEPVNLILGGVQLDEIAPEDFALMGTNAITPRWVNPAEALIIPGDDKPVWWAMGNLPLNPAFAPYVDSGTTNLIEPEASFTLTPVILDPPEFEGAPQELQLGQGNISFNGLATLEVNGNSLDLVTSWRQDAGPQPVKIFVHLLDTAGNIVTQWDGIGVEWEGWRTDDALVQIHQLPIEDIPAGEYRIVTGLYGPDSLERWQSPAGRDVIELGEVTIP